MADLVSESLCVSTRLEEIKLFLRVYALGISHEIRREEKKALVDDFLASDDSFFSC